MAEQSFDAEAYVDAAAADRLADQCGTPPRRYRQF